MIARLTSEAAATRLAIDTLPTDAHTALVDALRSMPARSVWSKLGDTVKDAANFAQDTPVLQLAGLSRPARPREYTEHARVEIARILAAVHVPLPVAMSAVMANRRRVAIARYEQLFAGDLALQLFGILATAVGAA
jgi:hypothetical protein